MNSGKVWDILPKLGKEYQDENNEFYLRGINNGNNATKMGRSQLFLPILAPDCDKKRYFTLYPSCLRYHTSCFTLLVIFFLSMVLDMC